MKNYQRQIRRSLVLVFGAISLPAAVFAQIGVDTFTGLGPPGPPAPPTGDGNPTPAKPEGGKDGKGGTPAEYAGPAKPGENAEADAEFGRARTLFDEAEWVEGLGIIDTLIGNDSAEGVAEILPETLYSKDGIRYVPLVAAIKQLLFELPVAAKEVYRATYEPPAKAALETALALPFDESLANLEVLIARFPMTLSAFEALESLGHRALDLGDPARAASVFDELLWRRSKFSPEEKGADLVPLRVKSALSHLVAGKVGTADRRLEDLRVQHGDRVVAIGGESISVAELHESGMVALLRQRLHRAPGVLRPPADNAAVDKRDPGEQRPVLGSRAEWIHEFSGDHDNGDESGRSFSLGPPVPRYRSAWTTAFPAVAAGVLPDRIFVRSHRGLIALEAASGKLAWRVDLADLRPGGRQPTGAGAAFDDIGSRMVSLVSGAAAGAPLAIVIDAPGTPRFDGQGKLAFPANRIHAYSAATGERKWTVGGPEAYPTELRTISFTAPPTAAGRDLLVAAAARPDGPLVVGLTSKGGLRWVTKLYEYDAKFLKIHRFRVGHGGGLAVSGGLALCARGDGVVSAVDVESGAIRWLSRYRALSSSGGPLSDDELAGQRVWVPTSPTIAGDLVIVAPHDSSTLVALELDSGELRWERDLAGDRLHFVGADNDVAFVTGSVTEAIAIADGKTLYKKTTGFEAAAGRGFIADGRIYLALENEAVIIDSASGEAVSRLGFTDERLPELKPGNLALMPAGAIEPDSPRLLAFGEWGVALVEPQQRSWERVALDSEPEELFERVQLLRAEGRDEEVFAALESVLADPPQVASPDTARLDEVGLNLATALFIATARDAASRRNDPQAIARVLGNSALELDDVTRSSLRLELARRLEESDPAKAASLYSEVIRDLRGRDDVDAVLTPDGVSARPDRYAAASLRLLVFAGKAETPKEENDRALEVLRGLSTDSTENADAGDRLRRIAFETPYLDAANEALARLAHMAAAEGDLAATSRFIDRLSAHPELKNDPTIAELKRRYASVLETQKTLPEGLADLIAPDIGWKQSFWNNAESGVLVETLDGSRPLDAVFSLRRGQLWIFSPSEGERQGAVPLPDSPDVENAKSQLRSHLEEPAMVFRRGEDAVLFSAAGVYQLVWDVAPAEAEVPVENAAAPVLDSPTVGWRHTYRHLLAGYPKSGRSGSATKFVGKIHGNPFPRFFVTPAKDQGVVLKTDGELFSVDLRTGKIRYRVQGVQRSPFGDATIVGTDLVTATVQPTGLLGYSLLDGGVQQRSRVDGIRFAYQTSGNVFRSVLVPGIAMVLDTSDGVRVTDPTTRRTLWSLVASRRTPALIRVTGSEVWVADADGFLRAHALLGGRVAWSISVPRNATALQAYPFEDDSTGGGDGEIEDGVWVVLAINATEPSLGKYKRVDRSGASLCLVKVTEDGKKLNEVSIGDTGVTFRDGRWVLGRQWLLAYNEADGGAWKSKVSGFDPATGELRALFEAPVSGHGSGRPPRLAVIAAGENGLPKIALGNGNGFGVFDASPQLEQEILVAEGVKWRFFRGVQEPSPDLEWTQADFDASDWEEGPSGFGYGDDDDATVLEDMQNSYTTVYVRHQLEIPAPERFAKVLLSVRADDGFVAYVNGQEVGRVRVPGETGDRLSFDTPSGVVATEPPPAEELEITKFLIKGKNVFAVQGVNQSLRSSDLSLIPVVIGELPAQKKKKKAGRVIDL